MADSGPVTPVHLLVLLHGMWGNPGHLAEMARIIRETKEEAGHAAGFFTSIIPAASGKNYLTERRFSIHVAQRVNNHNLSRRPLYA